jgi:hypothetical protein
MVGDETGYFPVGPVPRKQEFTKVDKSVSGTMAAINAAVVGRARMLELLLDEALADLPDAQFVTLSVYKFTEESVSFSHGEDH